MNLNMLSDFMKVLNSKRNHSTKNEYFPNHIQITIIYLLQKQKLNHNKYSEQEIIMINFGQDTEHYVHMYAKFGDLNFYEVL
jgi:hypothetical protein